MSNTAIRNKLYDYIRVADDKKLNAIYNLLENGSDKGVSVEQLEQSVSKLRLKKYGK